MKNINYGVLLGLLAVIVSSSSNAAKNIDVVTTISVGPIYMQLDIVENFSSALANFDGDYRVLTIDPQVPGAEIGVTVLDDQYYYGFSMLITGQSVANYQYTNFDLSATGDKTTNFSNQEITSRSSYNFYLGYALLDTLSLYGGVTFGSGSYGSQVNIDEYGPFLGARYTYSLAVTSSLNFDFSYSYIYTETNLSNENYIGGQHTISANNSALSYSATWLKALDRGRSFFVRLKINDLLISGSTDIESNTVENGIGIGTATISGNQVLTQLSLGMGF